MSKYVATVAKLVRAGYPKDKAILAVCSAWALSPEQIVALAAQVK